MHESLVGDSGLLHFSFGEKSPGLHDHVLKQPKTLPFVVTSSLLINPYQVGLTDLDEGREVGSETVLPVRHGCTFETEHFLLNCLSRRLVLGTGLVRVRIEHLTVIISPVLWSCPFTLAIYK